MTREEAKDYIREWCPYNRQEEIIEALEQEPTTKNDLWVDAVSRQSVLDLIADYDLSMGQVVRGIHALPSVTPQPCEDSISRQALLNATVNKNSIWNKTTDSKGENLETIISKLPSVTPQEPILDKIRAEISDFEEEVFQRPNTDYSDYAAVRHCLEIIDKYKAESEE